MAGYNWQKGKSNNAIVAEEEGLVNATRLSRILKSKVFHQRIFSV
ncbi:MAG TPA: hypothetical protein VNW06_02095 [Cytophagaceae bacterium]|jgi:hypothetical protein|nr:hypothetical protein [Cytophagaceae bacterium]